MMPEESLGRALREHDFFQGFTAEQLADLAAIATEVAVEPREMIFEEGGHADAAFAIVDGSVALEMNVAHRAQHIVQTLHRGEMLGWGWLFPPHRWAFSAFSLDTTHLIRFEADQLRALQEEDCALGFEMMRRFARVMTDRLAATRLQLVDFYADRY
jgi:CRP-like cAMP-binding protein